MLLPTVQAAAPGVEETAAFVARFNEVILFPIITLLMGVALLVFLYGCAIYIVSANNANAREDGRKHIMYGIIGMLIMLIAYSILNVAANTFGLDNEIKCANDPSIPGCNEVFRLADPINSQPSNPPTGTNSPAPIPPSSSNSPAPASGSTNSPPASSPRDSFFPQ